MRLNHIVSDHWILFVNAAISVQISQQLRKMDTTMAKPDLVGEAHVDVFHYLAEVGQCWCCTGYLDLDLFVQLSMCL